MAVSQGKMLGHYCRGGPGGYKCPCCKPFEGDRWRKREERREFERELAPVADQEWLLSLGLLIDPSDCRHGCNGSPCGSEQCTFICHEVVD